LPNNKNKTKKREKQDLILVRIFCLKKIGRIAILQQSFCPVFAAMESALKCLRADDSYLATLAKESTMIKILLVGIGGFIGSVLRYAVSGYFQQATQSVEFPYGTLAVNLIGCLVIGILSQLAETRGVFTAESRAFIFVGILGGFTTFSAFSNETMSLLREGGNLPALLNIGAHVVFGLAAVWLGRTLTHLIWR
jgi:CrcB protein